MSAGERMELKRIAAELRATFEPCHHAGKKERVAMRCARELEAVAGGVKQ